ncbi:hydroxyacylglutathione hydrolase-like protein isoform X4 [Balaenoptera acutorostrata]|uniref:Hydroxyacylglutathione hydrolase-like protein isoform X4 n=1 Tax=Balaenoptera acutorostrata TaxID=9767 RepID=A0ABM3S4L2_BALAC|nr:hydroxyacylglutathione hydrolase-like protein isoform X4 [Balaenoptera acutorostrata]
MKVKVIPVLEDNYMYLVIEEHTREAVAVDVAVPKRVRAAFGRREHSCGPRHRRPRPSVRTPRGSPDYAAEAHPLPGALCTRAWRPNTGSHLDHLHLPNSHPFQLLEIVGREGVSLTTVLTTHHHWDHAQGNTELVRLLPGLVVLGADERICALTRRLAHGEELRFGAIHVRCLLTPGHTSGHMSYFLWEDECLDPPAVFSGDALSVAGCGSRLETTAQQMYHSLVETLGTLPPETVSSLPLTLSWGPASYITGVLCTCLMPGFRMTACQPWGQVDQVRGEGPRHWGECLCPSLPMVVLCTPSAFFLQKVFCGHEHTLGNLEFAQKVEPCNNHVKAKLSWAKRGACVQVHREGRPS